MAAPRNRRGREPAALTGSPPHSPHPPPPPPPSLRARHRGVGGGCYGHSVRFPRARRPQGEAAAGGKWRAGPGRRRAPRGRPWRLGGRAARRFGGGVHPCAPRYSCLRVAVAHEGEGWQGKHGPRERALPGGAFGQPWATAFVAVPGEKHSKSASHL